MTNPDNVYDEIPYRHNTFPAKKKSVGAASIAGFILSILGFWTCGVLSVIGIILCIIGLQSEPRGLAVAGFIISLLGIAILMSSFLFAGGGMMAFLNMANFGPAMQNTQTRMGMDRAGNAIGRNWKENESLPDQKLGDKLILGIPDGWNNQLEYHTDGETFTLVSTGMDGISGTADDTTSGPFLEAGEAISNSIWSVNPTQPVIQNWPDESEEASEEDSTEVTSENDSAENPDQSDTERAESIDGDSSGE